MAQSLTARTASNSTSTIPAATDAVPALNILSLSRAPRTSDAAGESGAWANLSNARNPPADPAVWVAGPVGGFSGGRERSAAGSHPTRLSHYAGRKFTSLAGVRWCGCNPEHLLTA